MEVSRLLTLPLIVVYTFTLQFSYVTQITDLMALQGATDINPGLEAWLFSQAFALLGALFLPLRGNPVGTISAWMVYVIVYVPSCVVPLHILDYGESGYLGYVGVIMVCMWGLGLSLAANPLATATPPLPTRADREERPLIVFTWIVLGLATLNQIYLSATYGFNTALISFDFLDMVYSERAALADRTFTDGIRAAGYFVYVQRDVLLCMVFALGAYRRKWWLLAAALFGQFLVGITTAQRGSFGNFFLQAGVFLFYFSPWLPRIAPGTKLLAGITFSTVAVVTLAGLFGLDEILLITVRRVLLTNGMLAAYYFDYFSNAELAWYAQTLANLSGERVWQESYTLIIGDLMVPGSGGSANANFWSDSFANLGHFGPFVVTIVLALLLAFFVWRAHGRRPQILAIAFLGAISNFCGTGLQTAMLSGGMWAVALLTLLMPLHRPRIPQTGSAEPEAPSPAPAQRRAGMVT